VVLAGLFVFSAAVFAAFSRAGLLVFFAALVFSLVIGIRAEKIRTRLLPVMVVVAISFTLVHSLAGGWEEARQGRETGFSLDTGGWQSRVLQWQGAIEIYKDYPLFGSGLGTFKAHYPTVRTIEDLGTAGNFAHNDYVQMLSEGGPLLVLFVGAFVSLLVYGLIVQSFRLAWRQSEDVEPFLLIIAMGTALVHALMNFPLYQIQIQMMLGLLFARYIGLTGLIRWRRTTIRSPRLTRGAIVFGSIVIGAMPVLDAVSTDLVLNHKRIPIVSRIGDNFYTYRDTILFLRSVRSDNWMNRHAMSTIYRQTFDEQDDPAVRRGLAIAAAIECQEAIRLNPFILGIRSYCAEFLAQNSWLQDVEGIDVTAEGLLRDGVEIAPVDIESYLELADFLKSVGREQEAYRILVDEALPYINLKHGNYHEKRYELSLRVLRGARARNDESALERLMGLL
ncbi:MAG: O-antigen ligase family protein, partial [Pseudomonadales bacterium]